MPYQQKKYEDLQELLGFINAEHHNFYKNLKLIELDSIDKDYSLAIRQSDDEENEF